MTVVVTEARLAFGVRRLDHLPLRNVGPTGEAEPLLKIAARGPVGLDPFRPRRNPGDFCKTGKKKKRGGVPLDRDICRVFFRAFFLQGVCIPQSLDDCLSAVGWSQSDTSSLPPSEFTAPPPPPPVPQQASERH